jgi:hypothetical protein
MDDTLDVLIALSHTRLEHDEETMMPRRIVPDVALQHALGELELAGPEIVLVEVGEEPLAV